MNQREAKAFFENNREALNLLADRIKASESVRLESKYTPSERAAAIELVESWIIEVWGIAKEDFQLYQDDDNIIRRLEKPEDENL